MANAAIAAVNRLFWAPTSQRRRKTPAAQRSSCQNEVFNYILQCMLAYHGPPTSRADIDQDQESYDGQGGVGTVAPLQADLLSLPSEGGGFDAVEFVGPELAAYGRAEPSALTDRLTAEIGASLIRSGARIAKTVLRLLQARMVELASSSVKFPMGVLAVWKVMGLLQRFIVDGRPANCFFNVPFFEHTSGEDLARMIVEVGRLLLVAKSDLRDFFHTI